MSVGTAACCSLDHANRQMQPTTTNKKGGKQNVTSTLTDPEGLHRQKKKTDSSCLTETWLSLPNKTEHFGHQM